MMPDLGDYATEVLTAYGVTIALVLILIWLSLRSARKARARLDEVEAKVKRDV